MTRKRPHVLLDVDGFWALHRDLGIIGDAAAASLALRTRVAQVGPLASPTKELESLGLHRSLWARMAPAWRPLPTGWVPREVAAREPEVPA